MFSCFQIYGAEGRGGFSPDADSRAGREGSGRRRPEGGAQLRPLRIRSHDVQGGGSHRGKPRGGGAEGRHGKQTPQELGKAVKELAL